MDKQNPKKQQDERHGSEDVKRANQPNQHKHQQPQQQKPDRQAQQANNPKKQQWGTQSSDRDEAKR